MKIIIPPFLRAACSGDPAQQMWLEALPEAVARLRELWGLDLEPPFDNAEVSAAWVAPALLPDGTEAVLKIGLPHMEAEDEALGLSIWKGNPTVMLIDSDRASNAMLIERCRPGTHLRALPEDHQDAIVGGLLGRIWRAPSDNPGFRPLAAMMERWFEAAGRDGAGHRQLSSARGVFRELEATTRQVRLLATDLHAGNVLMAEREPWLVIDPKPFVGDPSYDVTQHLLNCRARLEADPAALIGRMAERTGVEADRVRRWLYVRLIVEGRTSQDRDLAASLS